MIERRGCCSSCGERLRGGRRGVCGFCREEEALGIRHRGPAPHGYCEFVLREELPARLPSPERRRAWRLRDA